MPSTTDEHLTGGGLTAAISNAVVRITAEYTGRGPTKARTSWRDDLVVVLLQDTMTKGERSLQSAGDSELVLTTRGRYQHAMREDLITAIEDLTSRTVLAFMSANHMDPDMGAEIFVLAPAAPGGDDALPASAKSDRKAHEAYDRTYSSPTHR
ncbi:MAG TPA: Na-translocating system protein MpsC family protein [Solirubrobacteraceae bacterium]|nr:Na-translocating system protein MpsC family protein [Solirubrobacteraceae bacterium]